MISAGYVIFYLLEQNLHGDWVRAEGGATCTLQPVRSQFRVAQNNFLLQWMGIIQLHLWETNSKKELKLCFPSLMSIRGVRMMLKSIRLKEIYEKNS